MKYAILLARYFMKVIIAVWRNALIKALYLKRRPNHNMQPRTETMKRKSQAAAAREMSFILEMSHVAFLA